MNAGYYLDQRYGAVSLYIWAVGILAAGQSSTVCVIVCSADVNEGIEGDGAKPGGGDRVVADIEGVNEEDVRVRVVGGLCARDEVDKGSADARVRM